MPLAIESPPAPLRNTSHHLTDLIQQLAQPTPLLGRLGRIQTVAVGTVGLALGCAAARAVEAADGPATDGPWRSFESVEMATLEWVDWSNNRRLLEPIGNIPPAEAEALYYAQIDEPAMVA